MSSGGRGGGGSTRIELRDIWSTTAGCGDTCGGACHIGGSGARTGGGGGNGGAGHTGGSGSRTGAGGGGAITVGPAGIAGFAVTSGFTSGGGSTGTTGFTGAVAGGATETVGADG